MLFAKVIYVYKDYKDKVYGYRLQDFNGNFMNVTPDDLKNAIRNNKLTLINMKLTSDGRLIKRKKEETLTSEYTIFKKPMQENDWEAYNKARELLHKMRTYISSCLGYKMQNKPELRFREFAGMGHNMCYGTMEIPDLGIPKTGRLKLLKIKINITSNSEATYTICLEDIIDSSESEHRSIQLKRPLDTDANIKLMQSLTSTYIKRIQKLIQEYTEYQNKYKSSNQLSTDGIVWYNDKYTITTIIGTDATWYGSWYI